MTHGSLFSGIGGFDLAAEWMGWQNVFHCEIEPFPRSILNYYWPNAISYEDITKTDFTIHRGQIDILTGGFPCQPYSAAGKRLGKEDDRHLWPEMLRTIREIQPRWIVGENVFGLVNWNGGLVFEEVQADLEAEGYEVQPFVIPACAKNAPHRRDRVWFVAYSESARFQKEGAEQQTARIEQCGELESSFSNSTSERLEGRFRTSTQGRSDGLTNDGEKRNTANANKSRLERNGKKRADTKWKNSKRHFRQSVPAWHEWPTQPPICSGNDGISSRLDGITFPKWRNESIKAYGNAVVPQVVYQIFKAIEQYENQHLR